MEFSEQQIMLFTNNFAKELGGGLTARVFEGRIPSVDGSPAQGIAVKVSKEDRALVQFKNEIWHICRFDHQNIIKLIGYCIDDQTAVGYLVYELAENGNLAEHITKLNWQQALNILKGTAQAIAYLHSQTPKLRYGDMKPENILLDQDYQPKLGDFGILGEEEDLIELIGTPGYLDPLMPKRGKKTVHDDVYAFGIVTLQVLLRMQFIPRPYGKIILQAQMEIDQRGDAVHPELRESGCTKSDAKTITYLALSLVEAPADLNNLGPSNLARKEIKYITTVLESLTVGSEESVSKMKKHIQKRFFNLKKKMKFFIGKAKSTAK